MKLRGRNILSVIAFLSVAVCLFLSAGKELQVHAQPSGEVELFTPDGLSRVVLDETNSYLVNNEAASSGVLGENGCTAYFDSINDILKFNGYDFGAVQVYSDVTIDLYGDNKVTNSGRDRAIYNYSGGIIKIQSGNVGSLEINNTLDVSGCESNGIQSIGDSGEVIICGDASVTINIDKTESYGFIAGIFAQEINILDTASVNVNINSTQTGGYGFFVRGNNSEITIDTLGDVNIDTIKAGAESGQNQKPIVNNDSEDNNLIRVGKMSLKYKYYTNTDCVDTYPAWKYDTNNFSKNESVEDGVKTTIYKYGTSHTISIYTGSYYNGQEKVVSEISCLEGEIVTITAPDNNGLEFKEWVGLTDAEFVDNTDVKSNPAKIKVGTSDISLRANYKAFSKEPSFVLTGETVGEGVYPIGKIDYTLANNDLGRVTIVSETGFMSGFGDPVCSTFTSDINADLRYTSFSPAYVDYKILNPGVYRLAVRGYNIINGVPNHETWYYSDPFTVVYSKPIKGIEIATAPTKTTYTAGEGFDPAGMEIKVTYTDESSDIIKKGFKWSPDNAFANGDDKVTISYTLCGETYTADLAVTVNPAYDVVESISVTTPPTKTSYIEGQSFDPAGMVVTATYVGGETKEITGYTITPSGKLTPDVSELVISYTFNGVTCSTTQKITVEPKCLESITITTPPTKTAYEIYDYFDKTGMVVTAEWNDGSTEVITTYTCTPEQLRAGTDTEVTVSYTDNGITKTAKQAVTVKALDSISITTPPAKTTYMNYDNFCKTGMVVTAKYNDNSTAEIKDYTIAPDGGLKTTDTSITISYTEKGITKTAIQAITVNERDDLEEIKIKTGPTKTAYTAGEVFNPAGMVVDAIYNKNTINSTLTYYYEFDNINGPLTFSPSGALSVDDTIITISYTEGGVTKTVTQEITVTAANSGNNETGNNGSENTENNNSGNSETGNNGSGNTENNNSGNNGTGNSGSENNSGSNSGSTNTGNNNNNSNTGNSGSGSNSGTTNTNNNTGTYTPVSTITTTPEVPGTTTKEVKNADGTKTTTTRMLEESGKVTETTVKESKNGDKTTTEVVIDGSGKIVSTFTETVSTDNEGTTTATTTTRKSDGSVTGSTVTTYESGKVVSTTKETKADKSVKIVEKTKQADGSSSKVVTKISAAGKAKLTVTTETPVADGKEAEKTEFVYSMIEVGKAKLVKVTTNEAEITIPATVTINEIQCNVVTIGKDAFKGNTSITKIVIGKYVETIGTKAFVGLKNLKEIYINATKLSKISKSAFSKISKEATYYIKAKKSVCKSVAALIKSSGVKTVNYERVK
jgi:hypothetical protein